MRCLGGRTCPFSILAAGALPFRSVILSKGDNRSKSDSSYVATVPLLRDAVLRRHPMVVNDFLQKAVKDGNSEVDCSLQRITSFVIADNEQYFPACTALLSSPLPSGFIVPTCLSPFIMQLVRRMAQNRCVETVFPLYQLMCGLRSSSSILNTIPTQTMDIVQTEFNNTLRNLNDHMGTLLCLATFAQIASSRNASDESELRAASAPPWFEKIRDLFSRQRALKALELVVLRVILACSASCNGMQVNQAAESIRLAIEICQTVGPDERKRWIGTNPAKVAKLSEKVARDAISPRVQIMVSLQGPILIH